LLIALRQRRFNPLNHALECDPELSAKENVVRAVDQLKELNTDKGAAGAHFDFMAHVLTNKGRCHRVEEQVQEGQEVLNGTQQLRCLTAGMNYKNGNVELGVKQFLHKLELQKQLISERNEKNAKKEETKKKLMDKTKGIKAKPEGEWTVAKSKTMCQSKSTDGDKPITKMKKDDLVAKWAVCKHRPDPIGVEFNIEDPLEELVDIAQQRAEELAVIAEPTTAFSMMNVPATNQVNQ
jgi:hypothetical protein